MGLLYFDLMRMKLSTYTLLQLDAAAPILAKLGKPVVIAKVNADKFTRLASKYDVEYVSLCSCFPSFCC